MYVKLASWATVAHVKISLLRNQPGQNYEFRVDIDGVRSQAKFISSADEGIREAMFLGILADCHYT
jgi:hypothetical protein